MRLRLAAAVTFAGLSAAVGLSQAPPKKDPPGTAPKAPEPVKPPAVTGDVSEQSFTSADGVKLTGRFYRAGSAPAPAGAPAMKASGAVVIMIGASGQKTDDAAWTSTAALLASRGFNVLQFDPRGSGGSTDITPSMFFANPVNRSLVKGASNPATKTTVTPKDFGNGYYPMYVQDLAAARNALDQMNDNSDVNTSTVYLLGTGDAAGLGLFFLASEWMRERVKPNIGAPLMYVSPRRPLFTNAEPAGKDYGAAVWISPARNTALNAQALKAAVLSPAAADLKNETPMLFVYGAKDEKSAAAAKTFATDILSAKLPKAGASKTAQPQTVYLEPISKADAASASGLKLLGNNTGAEDKIVEFLLTKEAERKGRTRKTREWDKPLIIDVAAFGFGR